MNLGTSIKTIRKQKGLAQKELAEKIGISQNALSQLEGNCTLPHKSTLNKICEALDVNLSYLFLMGLSNEQVSAKDRPLFDLLIQAISLLLKP